ncbi:JmjC domain-containing protein [Thecamonas trahens ATCC 50062]|uniref:JmjC domain-containing protein n=1 Tax=Thecamonas trahens ATCC 50062 TaxID=461836 RepID=A0A0L0DAX9_THETB|nr:JmjC domain-containing protein [Thecamonas trahens ATCC 50062]KNC49246.1 JmjC domain-containing protein [Thecamonas trahens ATCC 50062]|eukprot:XP_013757960.1 JmjC domain-containing protein [Thecamonas trahens ATCC 50062]
MAMAERPIVVAGGSSSRMDEGWGMMGSDSGGSGSGSGRFPNVRYSASFSSSGGDEDGSGSGSLSSSDSEWWLPADAPEAAVRAMGVRRAIEKAAANHHSRRRGAASPPPPMDADDARSVLPCRLGAEVVRVDWKEASGREALAELIASETPCVVVGAEATLPMGWDAARWKAEYGETTVPLNATLRDRVDMPLGWYLDLVAEQTEDVGLYLRNLHLCRWFPAAAAETQTPPAPMGSNRMDELRDVVPQWWLSWAELFISGCGTRTPLFHVDVCATHAWSGQIQGHKRFFVAPPSSTSAVYPIKDQPLVSRISKPDRASLGTFPEFASAELSVVDLAPGQLLYIPPGWWHTAVAVGVGPCITLGGNFVNDSNYERVAAAAAARSVTT